MSVLLLSACTIRPMPLDIDIVTPKQTGFGLPISVQQVQRAGGLQYIEYTAGVGLDAEPQDLVTVHYVGYLPDGTIFDNTWQHGQPIRFVLGSDLFITGWERGIDLMAEGARVTLILPADLAYGATGVEGVIPPDTALILDVEVISIDSPGATSIDQVSEEQTSEGQANEEQVNEEQAAVEQAAVEQAAVEETGETQISDVNDINEAAFYEIASGLRLLDLEQGTGSVAELGQIVTMHYTGFLSDGTQFASSLDQEAPLTIVLGTGKVIPGLEEGLIGMQEGGKRQLIVPPNLGYGNAGYGTVIPPDATLIFEVELLAING